MNKEKKPFELIEEMDFMVFNAVRKADNKHFKTKKILDKLYDENLFETSR